MYFVILAFIALASLLVAYFLRHDHGRKLPISSLWIAAGFGVAALIIAAAMEKRFLPIEELVSSPQTDLMKGFVVFMAIGFIEEAAKFLPLALYIFRKPYFQELTDGVIYFAVCGATFGLLENILYTTTMGTRVGVMRLALTPFLHAATSSILGYYLVRYKLQPSALERFLIAVFAIPALHGLYDFMIYSGNKPLLALSWAVTIVFSISMYLYFRFAGRVDRMMLRFVPAYEKPYCSQCGHEHLLETEVCEACGRKMR